MFDQIEPFIIDNGSGTIKVRPKTVTKNCYKCTRLTPNDLKKEPQTQITSQLFKQEL